MSDRFDELLDKVLHDESAVEPLAGLDERVMGRVREASGSASRLWMFAAWAGGLGVAAVVALVVFSLGRPGMRAVDHAGLAVSDPAAVSVGDGLPSGAKAPSTLTIYGTAEAVPLSKADSRSEGGGAAREARLSDDKAVAKMGHQVEVAQEDRSLPKLDVFPSPAPVDVFPAPVASEQGAAMADSISPQAAEALLALQKAQKEPVRIAAIVIPPLHAE